MGKTKIEDLEEKIDFSIFNKLFYESIPSNVWINSKEDMTIINFASSHAHGGIPVYTSENAGVLVSFDDENVFIIGIFFEGIVEGIKKFVPNKI